VVVVQMTLLTLLGIAWPAFVAGRLYQWTKSTLEAKGKHGKRGRQ
jgi:hypothetical protein